MLIEKRYRKIFTVVQSYLWAEIQSDHVPLVGSAKIKPRKIVTQENSIWEDNVEELSNNQTSETSATWKLKHNNTIQEISIQNDELRVGYLQVTAWSAW